MSEVLRRRAARISTKFLANKTGYALAVTVWVVVGFYAAQFSVAGALWVLSQVGLKLPVAVFSETVLTTAITALVYLLTLAVIAYVPYRIAGKHTTRDEVGLRQALPLWRDLGLAPLVYVACFICTAMAIVLLQSFVPGFDAAQQQEIPFDPSQFMHRYELLLIFITLAVVAPVAEELLFRGYLFGKLRKKLPVFAVILITSVVFSALHLGIGSLDNLQWNVAIDTFVLAIGLGLLRHLTGSVWASMLVHVIKNSIAFFVLFVLPRIVPAADMMQHLQ